MSNVSSLFIAAGKRFSVDCKVYGGRRIFGDRATSYSYESNVFDMDTVDDVINDVIPRVCDILMLSEVSNDREIAIKLQQSQLCVKRAIANQNALDAFVVIIKRAMIAELLRVSVEINGPSE